MNRAERCSCSLLGSFQKSVEEQAARSEHGLPWLAPGAIATPCLERPKNTKLTASATPPTNPTHSASPGFLKSCLQLSLKNRLHLALVQAGKLSGPHPYIKSLKRLRGIIRRARLEQLRLGQLVAKAPDTFLNIRRVELLGWTIPSHITQELEHQGAGHGDLVCFRAEIGEELSVEDDLCILGPHERLLYAGIRLFVRLGGAPLEQELLIQSRNWPVSARLQAVLDFLFDGLDLEEQQTRFHCLDGWMRDRSLRDEQIGWDLDDRTGEFWSGYLRFLTSSLHFAVAPKNDANRSKPNKMVTLKHSSNTLDFGPVQRQVLASLCWFQPLTDGIWPVVPVRISLQPGSGSFETSTIGLAKLPPGASSWVVELFSPLAGDFIPLVYKIRTKANTDKLFELFAKLMAAVLLN